MRPLPSALGPGGRSNQRSPVSGAIGRLASPPHLRATSGRLPPSCRFRLPAGFVCCVPPASFSAARRSQLLRCSTVSRGAACPTVWHIPPSGHRIASRAPYCACKWPPPPLPAPLRCCANSHHVHRLVCSGWKVHTDLLLGLAAATAALAGGLCFLVVLLGRHPAQPQGEPTALSPQHTAGSNDVCELWIGSTPRQGRPRGASTLVRQGQSAQALRQRVAQVPGGETGAACGCGSVSAVRASPKPGNVQAGPPSRPAGVEGRGYRQARLDAWLPRV